MVFANAIDSNPWLMLHVVMSVCIWSSAIWSPELQLSIMLPVMFCFVIVYAHGRRLCSTCNWVRHGSTTISYPQCSLTFMCERYLRRSFAYAKSAVGIDVVSVHKLFAIRVMSTVSTDIVSSHTVDSHTVSQDSRKHCKVQMNE